MSEPKCFYPDGSDASSDNFPCWNTSTTSTDFAPCCLSVDYCVSSGWCLSTNSMTTYRAGCTDQSWQSDSCVKQCTGAKLGGIYKCDDLGNSACEPSDCGTANEFLVASGSILLSGPEMTRALAVNSFVKAADLGNVSATVTVVSPSTTACASDNDSNPPGHLIAAVGLGLGFPLLLGLWVSLYFLWREKRKNRTQLQQLAHISAQDYEVFTTTHGKAELEIGTPWQNRAYQRGSIPTRHELNSNAKPAELST